MDQAHLQLIPKDFYSFETGEPFTECIECGKHLLDDQPYLIEKAYRNHVEYGVKETIFDYALCMNCANDLRNQMSKESMDTLMKFFQERLDMEKQFARTKLSAEANIGECMITGKLANECPEYQIYAYCINGNLSNEMPPYMMCGGVMEEILPLLSKKTTYFLNGFFDKNFSPDPSLMEPVGPKFVLV